MSQPPAVTVDVRDMLCAQALALVARAMKRLRVGQWLRVLYNAEDVKHDLLVWAQEGGRPVVDEEPSVLQIARGQ
jgi:TusA-related sulfurtransferase